jgi:hypothetical protein
MDCFLIMQWLNLRLRFPEWFLHTQFVHIPKRKALKKACQNFRFRGVCETHLFLFFNNWASKVKRKIVNQSVISFESYYPILLNSIFVSTML